jgi:hypothetical protein
LRERVVPFNWEIEFPEVFDRENGGFDAIVGNPPFIGGYKISTSFGDEYLAWIKEQYSDSGGQADLVAYFFRQAFILLRDKGNLGLVATNTITQGDTRTTGLGFVCRHSGVIYHAQTRLKWPGMASVIVSVVHIAKNSFPSLRILDSKIVACISAFLFPNDKSDNPKDLLDNAGRSFKGSMVLGMGFTFDDSNPDATPIAEIHRLIEQDPRNQERIFPYIGGEEVNSSPTHAHDRYVINFGEMSEDEAREWPDLMSIVEVKVKPERMKNNREGYRRYWWQYGEKRVELWKAIEKLDRVLVISRVSPHGALTFLPNKMVYSEQLIVFAIQNFSALAILQCQVHELWARFFSGSALDIMRYAPSNCFETFPFPENWETNRELESIGQEYYEFRAALMIRNNQGLTATYNRFHDPEEDDADILKLRQLHTQMDTAVLTAYGWTDISTTCEFRLDYEEDTPDTEPTEGKRQRKKPWRYRWPEATHDEVLARLLELNQHRHEAEILGGEQVKKKANKSKAKGVKAEKLKGVTVKKQLNLILPDVEQLDMF